MNLFVNNEAKCKKNIDLLDVLNQIIKTNKSYILRGGLAIALYYKKIYRCHKDIDLYLDFKDFAFWQTFFPKEYFFRRVEIPRHSPEIMYALYKESQHLAHIIFINDLNNRQDILIQVYRQKIYHDVNILEKYSKYIPIKEEDRIKALQTQNNLVTKIRIENKEINILDIKYLKEQKIFGILYRGEQEDEDMKYYFNCVI